MALALSSARPALDFQNHLIGAAVLAIAHMPDQLGQRIQPLQGSLHPRQRANNRCIPRQHTGMAALRGVYQAGGQVARSHVFVQRANRIGPRKRPQTGGGEIKYRSRLFIVSRGRMAASTTASQQAHWLAHYRHGDDREVLPLRDYRKSRFLERFLPGIVRVGVLADAAKELNHASWQNGIVKVGGL